MEMGNRFYALSDLPMPVIDDEDDAKQKRTGQRVAAASRKKLLATDPHRSTQTKEMLATSRENKNSKYEKEAFLPAVLTKPG